MSNATVRVRFAPSPTGHLHIGGLRTTIFNWLFARHHGGAFLLRIEDTDVERSKQEYLDSILDALKWMSLDSDEPIVIQTSRLAEHKKVIQQLLDERKAYRCFCSVEKVQELKEELLAEGKLLKYNGACREKNSEAEDEKKPFVVRFKLPYQQGPISFDDLVHGIITIDADQLEDFIIARSDGMPIYNFVVVVDDAAMKITHIIRGEDHISNTPKQILLYQACGYSVPQFAHIPLILGPSGDRLSKRDGAVSVIDYRTHGYLPDALFNYLVRLGFSHGDQEIFTKDELISCFSLKAVGKKGSIFDQAKLDWVNGVYLRKADNEYLLDQILAYVQPGLMDFLSHFSKEQILGLIGLYKERTKTLKELVQEMVDLHQSPRTFDQQVLQPLLTPLTVEHLGQLLALLATQKEFRADELAALVKQLCGQLGTKLGALAQPIRIALTGKTASPGVFELLALLKKEESMRRLQAFVDFLTSMQTEYVIMRPR